MFRSVAVGPVESRKRSSNRSLRSEQRRMSLSEKLSEGIRDRSIALTELYRFANTSTQGLLK